MAASWLPDSNILIAALNGEPAVLNRLAKLAPSRLRLSTIVLSELLAGAENSRIPAKARAAVLQLTRHFEALSYDTAAAQTYARIRAALERKGSPIGSMDMLIAAQALEQDLILVTDNERELRRVPGLRIENWRR
ncbi:MAG: type II toxin-antitoxin system VapC family toxin [Steroidobacteraceae bacterium]